MVQSCENWENFENSFFKNLDLDFEVRLKPVKEEYPNRLTHFEISNYLAQLKSLPFKKELNVGLGGRLRAAARGQGGACKRRITIRACCRAQSQWIFMPCTPSKVASTWKDSMVSHRNQTRQLPRAFKGNIGGYFKSILKAILGYS